MHSYLRSIGFSELKLQAEAEKLVSDVISNAHLKKLTHFSKGTLYVEYTAEYADDMGIIVRGEEDLDGNFHYSHFFPYFKGMNISCNEEIFISKRVDTDAYTGMCDDFRLGVSLIFYIQNVVDYYNYLKINNNPLCQPVILSALAQRGKIILPTQVFDEGENDSQNTIIRKSQLIAEARKGNQEAIESLTMEDIDTYAIVSQRIKNEDLFSIVDTSFVPYGSESDIYNVLGIITDISERENSVTKEKLWVLQIDCNRLIFDVCINSSDLVGEPAVGRRFRGTVWLQGFVEYT